MADRRATRSATAATQPLAPRGAGRVRPARAPNCSRGCCRNCAMWPMFFLLGAGSDAHAFFGTRRHVVLDYQRAELPNLLATIAPDAALLLRRFRRLLAIPCPNCARSACPGSRRASVRSPSASMTALTYSSCQPMRMRLRHASGRSRRRGALARVRSTLALRRDPDLSTMANA